MNKLKFRAFEKSLKEIIPVSSIDFDRQMINIEGAWRLFDEVLLMQSTGLLDKNGVEIFEGDVFVIRLNKHYWEYVVQYAEGSCVLQGWGTFCNTSVDPDQERYTFDRMPLEGRMYLSTPPRNAEVIGNIYTNPELLGESK